MKACTLMSYDSIRISRSRSGGFEVHATDPEIAKANRARSEKTDSPSEWRDPDVEYTFSDKEATLRFLDKALDIALPPDEFSSVFDKLAKEAKDDE